MSRRAEFTYGQQTLPGMPEPSAEQRTAKITRDMLRPGSAAPKGLTSEDAKRAIWTTLATDRATRPVGMRGSIPERVALSHRLEKRDAGRDVWASLGRRMADEDIGFAEDFEDDEDMPQAQPHPRTGLPHIGTLSTHGDIGFEFGRAPSRVTYHGSAATARRQAGTTKWIPVPGIRTEQMDVSSTRVHEALANPATAASPRLPFRELPHVWEEPDPVTPGHRTYTMIDGNHRMAANILQGALFAEANVLESKDIPKVQEITNRIHQAKKHARAATGVSEEEIQNRMARNVYRDEY